MVNVDGTTYMERLRERLKQKPDSKLFLSLAEELKKLDQIDEAVHLMVDGIMKNPDFLAAQVTLGRWYLHGSKFAEAQEQFSAVLKKAPDNSFARKGLAAACRGLGITEPVSEEYIKVHEIGPSAGGMMSAVSSRHHAPKGPSTPALRAPDSDLSKLKEAEGLIALGRNTEAMELYKEMLIRNPGNKRILQRKEELAALIKFLGKDKETIVKKLDNFLEAIKKQFAFQSPQ